MTVPPSTAERFAIIPLSPGPAPADAIIIGSMSAVMEYIPQSVARNDAHEELERARFAADQIASLQSKTRAVQASMLADSVNHLSARLDALVARRADEARERAKAEEEAEAQRIQDELNALPDPDDPTSFEGDRHIHGGELHTLSPKTEEEELEIVDQAEFPEPEDPTGTVIPQPTAVEFDGD
jgi:hypothetical protein